MVVSCTVTKWASWTKAIDIILTIRKLKIQNGRHLFGFHMKAIMNVMFSDGLIVWHSKTDHFGIQITFYHSKSGVVRYLDLYSIQIVESSLII